MAIAFAGRAPPPPRGGSSAEQPKRAPFTAEQEARIRQILREEMASTSGLRALRDARRRLG